MMSEALRQFARLDELPLVDVHDRFLELLRDEAIPRSTYFLSETDAHPNPTGYAELPDSSLTILNPARGHCGLVRSLGAGFLPATNRNPGQVSSSAITSARRG